MNFSYDLSALIPPEDILTIFDVGANIGQSAIKFRKQFRNAHIFCFEPVKSTWKELNKLTINMQNVISLNFALGDKRERLEININDDIDSSINSFVHATGSGKTEEVEVETIDRFCEENNILRIDILKIDVEGFELKVLKGAVRILAEKRIDFLYIETEFRKSEPYFVSLAEIDQFLQSFGYRIFSVYDQMIDILRNRNNLYFCNVSFVRNEISD